MGVPDRSHERVPQTLNAEGTEDAEGTRMGVPEEVPRIARGLRDSLGEGPDCASQDRHERVHGTHARKSLFDRGQHVSRHAVWQTRREHHVNRRAGRGGNP